MIDFEEDWLASVLFRWRGSAAPRALWFALPSAILAPLLLALADFQPGILGQIGTEAVASSVLWSSTTACVVFLVGFRSRQALGRFWEGTGLLHQMRGEWFDAVSCLMTFSRAARGAKPKEVAEFRHVLVRLMSLMHGSALEEIQANAANVYEVIDIRGLDMQTRSYLTECKDVHNYNRVEVLLHMVQVLVTQNLDDGVLKIAPPILSRVYQTLSRGLVNLLNARKITDTKFPFPYVQLITVLLIFHSLLTPVVIAAIIQHKVWAALFTFMPVFGLVSLNFIAIELEVPFGDDDNDLPLDRFQRDFNKSLLMLLSDEADHLVTTSNKAVFNMVGLTKSLTKSFTGTLDGGSVERGSNCSIDITSHRVFAPDPETGTKSIFDTDEPNTAAVAEAKLKPADDTSRKHMPVPREHPPKGNEQGKNEELELSVDFIVRPHTHTKPASTRDIGAEKAADIDLKDSNEDVEAQIPLETRIPLNSEGKLEELGRSTEAVNLMAAAAPQLSRWEAQSWTSGGILLAVDAVPREPTRDEVELNGETAQSGLSDAALQSQACILAALASGPGKQITYAI